MEIKRTQASIRTSVTLKTIAATDHIVVYQIIERLNKIVEQKGDFELTGKHFSRPQRSIVEGITTVQGIHQWLNGDIKYLPNRGLTLIKKDLLEYVRCNGWPSDSEGYKKWEEGVLFNNFFKRFQENSQQLELVQIKGGSHMLFDVDDQPLPVAVYCDYISGLFENKYYDLEKTVKILSGRDDIKWFPPDSEWDRTKMGQGKIHKVPHYNQNDCHNRLTVKFIWQPDANTYRRLWQKQLELDNIPSAQLHQAIFELDIFGLREQGATTRNNYYEMIYDEDKLGNV